MLAQAQAEALGYSLLVVGYSKGEKVGGRRTSIFNQKK
jgi:hypothetical protein